MIQKSDILRPTADSPRVLQVWAVRGKFVDVYDPTCGTVNPKLLSRYEGWVIERRHQVVGTV